jgi:hypothetical protein
MNVSLFHGNHRHVSAIHVFIFGVVRTKIDLQPQLQCVGGYYVTKLHSFSQVHFFGSLLKILYIFSVHGMEHIKLCIFCYKHTHCHHKDCFSHRAFEARMVQAHRYRYYAATSVYYCHRLASI